MALVSSLVAGIGFAGWLAGLLSDTKAIVWLLFAICLLLSEIASSVGLGG
jgi:hypothetical protein